jgi:hypothetical protein
MRRLRAGGAGLAQTQRFLPKAPNHSSGSVLFAFLLRADVGTVDNFWLILDLPYRFDHCCGAMKRQIAWWIRFALLTAGLSALRCDATPRDKISGAGSGRMSALPRITLWTWERREDLRSVDAATTAVAYLDRTILVSAAGVVVKPQRQTLLLPGAKELSRIAVVRIETTTDAALNEASSEMVAAAVAGSAGASLAALQIDFDARKSEREWYRTVLTRVRAQIPAAMPLSMTALASWCSYDNAWMVGLPVDEAVPMLFRMEPDRRRAAMMGLSDRDEFTIREPLCQDSVGISTRERWPRDVAAKRAYVFPDAGWQRDDAKETVKRLW